MQKKIVIIGAGPIGCYTAQALKLYGFNPVVVEEHREVGRPVHCTGLVGNKLFSEKRLVALPSSAILNTINGAVLHYAKQSFVIKRKGVAYVIDRERFDKELSRGLNILFDHKYLGFEKKGSGYIVATDKDELPADMIIAADGASSVMRKVLNPNTDYLSTQKGLQLRMQTKVKHKDLVQVYLAKSSFFWVVPEADNIVRVGTISDNPYHELQGFLKEEKIKGEVLERFGGLVSIGVCQNTVSHNIALVGDAACQLKPLTYGGIYFGLRSATILANCIKANRLKEYDTLWKNELGLEIRVGIKIKQAYNKMSKKEIGKLFLLIKDQKQLLEKLGDFENHSRFILEVVKRPAFYPRLGELVRIMLKAIF